MKQSRLSCPSWVIPGTYGENLAFLETQGAIQNIELLFFIYDGSVKLELERDLNTIIRCRGRFTYTAHLPDRLNRDHEQLITILSPLVDHFVFHPVQPEEEMQVDELAHLIKGWQESYGDRFLAENTKPLWLDALEERLPDIPICMDTGHLGQTDAILDFWQSRKGRIREIHLHSTDEKAARLDGRLPDHRPLRGDEAWLEPLVTASAAEPNPPLINLELFSWQEVEQSLNVIQRTLNYISIK